MQNPFDVKKNDGTPFQVFTPFWKNAEIRYLNNNNINTEHIHSIGVNTTNKNRYFSNGKQLMRLDLEEIHENWQPPNLSNFANNNYDVIILSDYNKGVVNDLLVGDKNALMLGTRVLGYGKEYEVTITDPDTGLEVDTSFDLSKLKTS